ncbi:MAG: zinc-ribbon domain-containing protein [Candidatus Hodarchaeota archaeon]
MFCPNCGEKLTEADQRFCHNCGSEILTTSDAPQIRTEQYQRPSTTSVPLEAYAVKTQPKPQMGEVGKYSKMCLGFALVSIGIGIITLIAGGALIIYTLIPYFYLPTVSPTMIGVILMHVAGLIFGILSKVNSGKASRMEPYNNVERAGSVLGIFGIVINAIAMVLVLIFMMIPLFAFPWYIPFP